MREPLEIYATEAKFASNEAVYIFLQLETDESFRALENASCITKFCIKHPMGFGL